MMADKFEQSTYIESATEIFEMQHQTFGEHSWGWTQIFESHAVHKFSHMFGINLQSLLGDFVGEVSDATEYI